jgi:hypothetical protein
VLVVAAAEAVAATLVVGPDQRQGLSRVNCCDIAHGNDFRVTRTSDVYCL